MHLNNLNARPQCGIIKYGIIIWNNSSNTEIFTLQKQIFRITAAAQSRTSFRSLLKQLEILSVTRQYFH